MRYLTWLSIHTKVFNVGDYRRVSNEQPSADFFLKGNEEGSKMREQAAMNAFSDLVNWLNEEGGIVGILDATNTTKVRRKWITDKCQAIDLKVMFIESICDSEEVIMQNIMDVKLSSPDYLGQDAEKAAQDFRQRIKNYEDSYEPIEDSNVTYVKIINVGEQIIVNLVHNFMQSRIIYYLMNLHIRPRSIWLSRHGESEFNLAGRIGGDAPLSSRGVEYAKLLPEVVKLSVGDDVALTVWTSTLKRTIQTAANLPYSKLQWKALDELDAGVCDALTYEEIEALYPEDFANRDNDKFNYRYRGGESYQDVITRLEPVIMELERRENVLVVAHQAVIRCIYAYYMSLPQSESPWINIPLHTVMKLTPTAYKTHEERYTRFTLLNF